MIGFYSYIFIGISFLVLFICLFHSVDGSLMSSHKLFALVQFKLLFLTWLYIYIYIYIYIYVALHHLSLCGQCFFFKFDNCITQEEDNHCIKCWEQLDFPQRKRPNFLSLTFTQDLPGGSWKTLDFQTDSKILLAWETLSIWTMTSWEVCILVCISMWPWRPLG